MAGAGPKTRRRFRQWMLTKLWRLRQWMLTMLTKLRTAMEDKMHWEGEWQQMHVTSPCATSNPGLWTMPSDNGPSRKRFYTACVCCKRPLTIDVLKSPLHGSWRYYDEKFAYMAAIWGADQGYALGALVLGQRLRELGTRADLVLLHTDDVPSNYLTLLKRFWLLRLVDYIDGARSLYLTKGTNFDGVFTKINAWAATEYNKVLLLDIDMIPLQSLDELFTLSTPAAMARGNHDFDHGDWISGSKFFRGDKDDWPWAQGGGINAGVILLEPDKCVFERMWDEVTTELHPEHIAGSGPEQDYLSRFFAAAPWHHISVSYNFQPHHVLFALEYYLETAHVYENGCLRG